VELEIPPQPHGRHLQQILRLIDASEAPADVKARAAAAFTAVATVEAAIHDTTVERVHLHEVGAVDALVDILGAIWGLHELRVTRVFNGPVRLGDGTVESAHGSLPVPAPATLKLLEGFAVRPGPEGAGELVTPTGAALLRVLSQGSPPDEYVPVRSGYGAGEKDFRGRANALRLVLAEPAGSTRAGTQQIVLLACDVDDMTPEHVGSAVEQLRGAGALDVFTVAVGMKKNRLGTRIELLSRPEDADRLETVMLEHTSTLGVRRTVLSRRALPRVMRTVEVLGFPVRMKVVELPGGTIRRKPEYEDVSGVARATGRSLQEISALAMSESDRREQDHAVAARVARSPSMEQDDDR
jgi:uncharacterized protein (TIGR00299 family) protein